MWRDDPRDLGPRSGDRTRGSGSGDGRDRDRNPREVFTRDLAMPRGHARERIRVRHEVVELRASEVRTLATVGAFRVVPANDLRDQEERRLDASVGDLRHLREAGLVRTMPYMMGRSRTTLVTLTERGRDVLESVRREPGRPRSQGFYHGLTKSRELAHDSALHRAYTKVAERLVRDGGRIHRVVLDHELKRDYQRFLQAANRGRRNSHGQPLRDHDRIERWALQHDLPYLDGHVHFPDVRIEYEDRDGRNAVEDVEVETPHYRGAHAAAKARSGFTCFRASGARLGGGSTRGGAPFDPGHAEDLVS
jgi:hypothetical protein